MKRLNVSSTLWMEERTILGISWKDSSQIMKFRHGHANNRENIIRERRLWWFGHVVSMNHQWIPKQALQREIPDQGNFLDNVTGGDIRLRGKVVGSYGVQTSRPSQCNMYTLLNIIFYVTCLRSSTFVQCLLFLPQVLSQHGFWHVARQ